jgi:DNA-binding LytR/AlgR family response regulator
VKLLLEELGVAFSERQFARIGRSLLINLDALRAIERLGSSHSLLQYVGTSETVVIGRAASSRVRQLIEPARAARPMEAANSGRRQAGILFSAHVDENR